MNSFVDSNEDSLMVCHKVLGLIPGRELIAQSGGFNDMSCSHALCPEKDLKPPLVMICCKGFSKV